MSSLQVFKSALNSQQDEHVHLLRHRDRFLATWGLEASWALLA